MMDSWWPHDHRLPKMRDFGYQKEPIFVSKFAECVGYVLSDNSNYTLVGDIYEMN